MLTDLVKIQNMGMITDSKNPLLRVLLFLVVLIETIYSDPQTVGAILYVYQISLRMGNISCYQFFQFSPPDGAGIYLA